MLHESRVRNSAPPPVRTCSAIGCGRRATVVSQSRGFCATCYGIQRSHAAQRGNRRS